jgi:hypothetical protein
MERNSLLRATVSLCRTQVKFWALNQFAEGKISITDVHLMGFLVPGETGGRHGRKGETNVLADIRVHVLGPDFVRVSLSNSYGKNAAQAAGGWPAGVRFALIVITAVDGNREIVRRITTRLRNTIQLPQGLHGRQFLVEASFLKHVDDVPRFSSQQTFTLPYMTEDITANLSHKQNESKNPEMEALRKQMERLTVAVEGLMKDRGADPVGQKPR